jgi:hypothetical protein
MSYSPSCSFLLLGTCEMVVISAVGIMVHCLEALWFPIS